MDWLDVLILKAPGFFAALPPPEDLLLGQLPFILFVAAVILGNLWDRKKPRAQKPQPFPGQAPLPDIKRPAEMTPDVRPIPQPRIRPERVQPAAQEPCPSAAAAADAAEAAHAARLMDVPLAQAVIAAEVLGRPRALRPRRR